MRKLVGTRRFWSYKVWKFEEVSHEMLVLRLLHGPTCLVSILWFSSAVAVSMGKLQKLSFSKVSKQVVMSFCVANVALCDIPTCLITCRKSFCMAGAVLWWVAVFVAGAALWRPPSSFCVAGALHLTLHTLHFTLHTPLYTPHSTLCTLHCALCIPHFTLDTLHYTLHTLHFTLHTLHSTLYTPHFTLYTSHFTFHISHPHSTLYTPHSTLYSLDFTLYTLHSTLYTPHFTLYTLHSTLYTPHFTPCTQHFTLHTPHFTLCSPHFALHPLLHSTVHSALVR